jgi:hypothetical protein
MEDTASTRAKNIILALFNGFIAISPKKIGLSQTRAFAGKGLKPLV